MATGSLSMTSETSSPGFRNLTDELSSFEELLRQVTDFSGDDKAPFHSELIEAITRLESMLVKSTQISEQLESKMKTSEISEEKSKVYSDRLMEVNDLSLVLYQFAYRMCDAWMSAVGLPALVSEEQLIQENLQIRAELDTLRTENEYLVSELDLWKGEHDTVKDQLHTQMESASIMDTELRDLQNAYIRATTIDKSRSDSEDEFASKSGSSSLGSMDAYVGDDSDDESTPSALSPKAALSSQLEHYAEESKKWDRERTKLNTQLNEKLEQISSLNQKLIDARQKISSQNDSIIGLRKELTSMADSKKRFHKRRSTMKISINASGTGVRSTALRRDSSTSSVRSVLSHRRSIVAKPGLSRLVSDRSEIGVIAVGTPVWTEGMSDAGSPTSIQSVLSPPPSVPPAVEHTRTESEASKYALFEIPDGNESSTEENSTTPEAGMLKAEKQNNMNQSKSMDVDSTSITHRLYHPDGSPLILDDESPDKNLDTTPIDDGNSSDDESDHSSEDPLLLSSDDHPISQVKRTGTGVASVDRRKDGGSDILICGGCTSWFACR